LHQFKKAAVVVSNGQIQEGGRFAALVPNCPNETHNLLMPVAPIQKGDRFAAADVSSRQIREGGRFAAVVVPNCPNETHTLLMPVTKFKKSSAGRCSQSFRLPNS
jgi:hypothetical protein